MTYALRGEHIWGKGGVTVERVCGWEHKNEGGRGLAYENETEPGGCGFGPGSTNRGGDACSICVGC